MTTYTFDENIVSDLYKEVYGTRSAISLWPTIDADKQVEWDRLLVALEEVVDEDARRQAHAAERFEARVAETMAIVQGSTRADAIRLIAQAEGCERDIQFYGWESLEYDLGLKFGYIKEPVRQAA